MKIVIAPCVWCYPKGSGVREAFLASLKEDETASSPICADCVASMKRADYIKI